MKAGACFGGTIVGYFSQWIGRRRSIIAAALISGVMMSSPFAQIVNAIAESVSITGVNGKLALAYSTTMAVATAIVVLGITVTTAFGPEKRCPNFEQERPDGMAEYPEPRDIEAGKKAASDSCHAAVLDEEK
jgi:hypothetical protein